MKNKRASLSFFIILLFLLPQPLYAAAPSAPSGSAGISARGSGSSQPVGSATRPCDNLPAGNYVATFDDIGNLQCRKEGGKTLVAFHII